MTEKIIGYAYKVYNTLDLGFVESFYENALTIELKKTGLKIEKQKRITNFYEGKVVGNFRADIITNDLVATIKPVGLLLNFGPKKVKVKKS